jgi:integrase
MQMFTVAGIHFETGTISKLDIKKKRWVEVGISPELLRDLRQYIDSFGIKDKLFPFHWKTFNTTLQKACAGLGIEGHVSWHLLRRSFVSKAEDKGYTLKEVMHITGDSERTVARYYNKVSVADLGQKASRFYQEAK